MQQSAIKLSNVSKRYLLHHQKPTLMENIFKIGRNEDVWALKDINLDIKKGGKIGIIGNNGSGKTTLLKIITGITHPTCGKIEINGRIASLINLEAGFHPELTGEENIYLNGMILGMSKNEIRRKFSRIIEFSALGKYIDAPFYTYSSGMALRLGFSIAIHSDPDILLIDEVLSVGDQDFREKSYKAILSFLTREKTVIFISHYLQEISRLCNDTIVIDQGKIKFFGESKKAINLYKSQKL